MFQTGGGFDSDCVVLASVPFFAVMGLGLALCTPLSASAQIVTVQVRNPARILDVIAENGVTHAPVAPPVIAEIAADASVDRPAPRLQFMVSAARTYPQRISCAPASGWGAWCARATG